jgi:hypothetical protein
VSEVETEQAEYDDSATSEMGTIDSGDVESQEADTLDDAPNQEAPPENDDYIPDDQITEKVRKRFDTLTAKAGEAERARVQEASEKAALQARLDAIDKAKEDEVLAQQPPAPPSTEDIFDPEEFERKNLAYLQERDAFIAGQAVVRAKQQAREEFAQQAQLQQTQKLVTDYTSRVQEFAKEAPDFQEIVRQQLTGLNQDVALELMKIGPGASYYVAKNPELRNELHFADYSTRQRILGRIEAKITGGPQPRKITGAGDTIDSLNTTGATLESDPIKKLGGRIE